MHNYSMNSKVFFQALAEGNLIGSQCNACGTQAVPQRQICPACHSDDTVIVTFSGEGKLVAYTVISVPPVMMAEAGYDAKNPYCVGIVELKEGVRVSAQLLGFDISQPEAIKVGTPVEMTTIVRGEGEQARTFLAFTPA